MRLDIWSELELTEMKYLAEIPLTEDEAGPRLNFNYGNWKHDPTPDILLLGSYQHPNTGNNLVGGVNLHYLNSGQRDRLARVLPQLMEPTNLYGRYWAGRRLLPDVFEKYYRTYNSRYIQNAAKAVMYPKYGVTKAALNWLRKKVLGAFKSKKQRELDDMPKYPDDLSNLQNRLDLATGTTDDPRIDTPKPPDPQPETDTMRRARMNFMKLRAAQQRQQRQQILPDLDDVDDIADLQLQQAQMDASNPPTPQVEPEVVEQPTQPTPDELRQSFIDDAQENAEELNDPRNDIEMESIVYYSPKHKRYITESIALTL